MRLLAAAFVLAAGSARAATTFKVDLADGTATRYGQEACRSSQAIALKWSAAPALLASPTIYTLNVSLKKSDDQCPETGTLKTIADADLRTETRVTLYARDVFGSECPADKEFEKVVCFVFKETVQNIYGGSTTTTLYTATIGLFYDAQPPLPPIVTGVGEGDQRLSVYWATNDPAPSRLTVFWRPAPEGATRTCLGALSVDAGPEDAGDGGFADAATADAGALDASTPDSGSPDAGTPGEEPRSIGFPPSAGKVDIDRDVENGLLYELWLKVADAAGNVSGESEHCVAGPRQVNDFWAVYHQHGGQDYGGCGCAAVAAIPLAPLLLAALLRRRRR